MTSIIELSSSQMQVLLTIFVTIILFIFIISRRKRKPGKPLPYFFYPRWKNLNYYHAKKSAVQGNIPKIFHPCFNSY